MYSISYLVLVLFAYIFYLCSFSSFIFFSVLTYFNFLRILSIFLVRILFFVILIFSFLHIWVFLHKYFIFLSSNIKISLLTVMKWPKGYKWERDWETKSDGQLLSLIPRWIHIKNLTSFFHELLNATTQSGFYFDCPLLLNDRLSESVCPWRHSESLNLIYIVIQNLFFSSYVFYCPVGFDCRIPWLHYCKGVRFSQQVSWIWHEAIW